MKLNFWAGNVNTIKTRLLGKMQGMFVRGFSGFELLS